MTARDYYEAGLFPIPLPEREKSPPPSGYTGWKNEDKYNDKATREALHNFLAANKYAKSNIALWLGPGYLGIDVDAYKEDGAESLERLEEELGPLPDTWISSARSDGVSGIRIYRVPEGPAWPGKLGDGIETIHKGHRYATVAPSAHDKLKDEYGDPAPYLWYAPGEGIDGYGSLDVPNPKTFTKLSGEWVEGLSKGKWAKALKEKNLGPKSKATKTVSEWIEARSGEPCSEMARVLDEIMDDFEGASAHDSMTAGIFRLAALSVEGHAGLSFAASRLEEAFLTEVERDDRDGTPRGRGDARDEWLRSRDGAVKKIMALEEEGAYIGSKCLCTGLTPEGKPKPRLDVTTYYIPDALEICYAAIAPSEATKGYGVYHTGGELQLLAPGHYGPIGVDALRTIVARTVDWYRLAGGEAPAPVPANPPDSMLKSMLEDHTRYVALPELRGVMKTPFWASVDGKPTLVHQNGYHEGAKVFLDMTPQMELEVVENMDEEPSARYVERAIEMLDEMVCDFPFDGPADRAAFFAAVLLPFCRDLIQGPTPLHLMEAPTAGTGKGLLANAISMVSCGALDAKDGYQMIAVRKGRDRNEELAKEITARMRAFPRVLIMDNISHTLDSSEIASALTGYPTYQGRVLGSSVSVEVSNRALWVATANNLTASDEIRRRIVNCRMDSGLARPGEQRTFRHGDLLGWIVENRPGLVWACLTIIANWVANDMPAGRETMGSFDQWARVMGGILAAAGIKGLLTNRDKFNDRAKDEGVSLEGLVVQWVDQLGVEEKVSATQVAMLEASEDLVEPDGRDRSRRLGRILSDHTDALVGEYFIRKSSLHGRSAYYLEPKDGAQKIKRRRRRQK